MTDYLLYIEPVLCRFPYSSSLCAPKTLDTPFGLQPVMQIDPFSHHTAPEIQWLRPLVFINGAEPLSEEVMEGGWANLQ